MKTYRIKARLFEGKASGLFFCVFSLIFNLVKHSHDSLVLDVNCKIMFTLHKKLNNIILH